MSKAFGLASLRIGFLISNINIINDLYKVKPVHEISGVSAKIGSFLINDQVLRMNICRVCMKVKRFCWIFSMREI